jgi:glycosyltransferase involved in cell wall biosynthesis
MSRNQRADRESESIFPFISIVVPVYNGRRTIQRCIDSLLVQTYPPNNYEIIIVDNNSVDETTDIVSGYKKVKLLRQNKIQNSYYSRNLGSTHACGEIIAFTDADCIADPNWLIELSTRLANEEICAVGGAVINDEPTNLVEAFLSEINPLRDYYKAPGQFLQPIITANAAFKRHTFNEFGGFNANLYTGADIDLAWRMQLRYGNCVSYAPNAVVYHKHRSSLKGMFLQYRRHGFGEIFLDAIYCCYPGYPRSLQNQQVTLIRQTWAVLKNIRSFTYRLFTYPYRRDLYTLIKPLLWMVAECGNIWGKMQGLWATRMMRVNPSGSQWQDPGG